MALPHMLLCSAMLILLGSYAASAQAPTTISYQGYLEQNGAPYPDGTVASLTFRIHEYLDIGDALWTETHTNVPIADGVFDVVLGNQVSFPSFVFTLPPYLGISVNGGDELTPRTPLAASPAAHALVAGARVDGSTLRTLQVIHRDDGIASTGYGIWAETLHSEGTAIRGLHVPATGKGTGIRGISLSPEGFGGVFDGGVGVAARSRYNGSDLILGGFGGDGTGVLTTDPDYPSSDLVLQSNDDIGVYLDADGGDSGALTVLGGSTNRFQIHENGTVTTWGRGRTYLNSTTGDPHLLLQEDENGDYARLRLRNTSNTRFWDVAAGGSGNDRLNFFRDGVGDIMTVRSSGRVGIMTLSPEFTLEVNGSAGKPGGGSWAVASDARLKTVAGPYEPGLDAVLQLEPVRYHYRRDNPRGFSPEPEHIGFVAQQVREVIPEAVTDREDYLYLNNDPILWAMVNAVQELHEENERLARDNQKLQRQISAIAERIGLDFTEADYSGMAPTRPEPLDSEAE